MIDMTPTVLIVPGLRDDVPNHWQTLLAQRLPDARSVPAMGRQDLDCQARVRAIEQAVSAIEGPVQLVAHSGGCIMLAHWAQVSTQLSRVHSALLATPPDFETPMPSGYPGLDELAQAGWLPVPRQPLPFRSLVAASRNDPLGRIERIAELAARWGSEWFDLGEVGHLNPASGHGDWPLALTLLEQLRTRPAALHGL